MKAENDFRRSPEPHGADAPDESLRKINKLQLGGTFVDGSGTITLGGDSQQVFAERTGRRYLFLLNISDEELWVNFGTDAEADQPSIKITAGGYYEPYVPPTQAVHIFGATTGKAFVAKEI